MQQLAKLFLVSLVAACTFAQSRATGPWQPSTVTFAQLGTPANGTVYYCSDCTQANPTASGGTGALVRRENGVWNGGGGAGGGGLQMLPIPITPSGALSANTIDPGSGAVFATVGFAKAQTVRYGWTFRRQNASVTVHPFFVTDDGSGGDGNAIFRVQAYCTDGVARMGLATQVGSTLTFTLATVAGGVFYRPISPASQTIDVSSCPAGAMMSIVVFRDGAAEATEPSQGVRLAGGHYIP